MNTIILKFFLFQNIHFDYSTIHTYLHILHSDKPIIIVSNHRSLFDGFVLMSIFGNLSFIVNDTGMSLFPGIKTICDKLGFIQVKTNKKTNATKKIIDYTNNRKSSEPILTIFPDSLHQIPSHLNIAPFKSGAFVGKFDILPIIIKYKNYDIHPFYWGNNEPRGFSSIIEKLLDQKCEVYVEMLPITHCDKNMSIEQYKNHVFNIMNTHYDKM